MDKDRKTLPFRKNCEGYFLNENGEVLAKETDLGIIIFPGGGIDEGENIEDGMKRETFEETGARVNDLKLIDKLKIVWGENWAKTDKQKKRYLEFQGDEMHFFSGRIDKVEENLSEEDSWNGNKFLNLNDIINKIKLSISEDESTKEYRKTQIKLLEKLRNE